MHVSLALFLFSVTLPTSVFVQGASAQPAAAAADTADDPNKLICRREVPVGSLIASRKMCLTKAQWAERERIGSEVARRMVEDNQGRPTGN